jgi:hypothetical protein
VRSGSGGAGRSSHSPAGERVSPCAAFVLPRRPIASRPPPSPSNPSPHSERECAAVLLLAVLIFVGPSAATRFVSAACFKSTHPDGPDPTAVRLRACSLCLLAFWAAAAILFVRNRGRGSRRLERMFLAVGWVPFLTAGILMLL